MTTFRLRQDVFSETLNRNGHARYEGWLPAGTVVEVAPSPDASVWTGQCNCNRSPGLTVRVVQQVDGSSGAGLAHECLTDVRDILDVADPVARSAS
jgi:hypothetical protein